MENVFSGPQEDCLALQEALEQLYKIHSEVMHESDDFAILLAVKEPVVEAFIAGYVLGKFF